MEVTCDFLTVINGLPFNIEQVPYLAPPKCQHCNVQNAGKPSNSGLLKIMLMQACKVDEQDLLIPWLFGHLS